MQFLYGDLVHIYYNTYCYDSVCSYCMYIYTIVVLVHCVSTGMCPNMCTGT